MRNGVCCAYRTDVTRQAISRPEGETRYTRSSPLKRSGKSVMGSTFISPLTPKGLTALPMVISIPRNAGQRHGVPERQCGFHSAFRIPHSELTLLRFRVLLHDPDLGEQGLYRIGRDCTLLEPVEGLGLVDLDLRRFFERVVGSEHLDEPPVPCRTGIRHHQAVIGLLVGPHSLESDLYRHCFTSLLKINPKFQITNH